MQLLNYPFTEPYVSLTADSHSPDSANRGHYAQMHAHVELLEFNV